MLRGGAIAAVVAVILVLEGVYAGQLVQLHNVVMNRATDLVVAQAGVSNMIAVRSVLPQYARQDVEAVPGVLEANPLTGLALIYEQGELRTPISLFVYDTRGGPVHLVSGRQIIGDREIIIDESLAKKYDLVPGDSFVLSDFEFRIAGISHGEAAFFTPFGFIRFDDLIDFYFESELAEDISSFPLLSFLLVDVTTGSEPSLVAERIEAAVPSADVLLPEDMAAHDVAMGKIAMGPIFDVLIAVGYVIGLLVTGIIMFSATNARQRDMGVMKALGFSNLYLVAQVLMEALLLVSLAIPVGVFLAQGIAALIQITAPLYLILPLMPDVLFRTFIACWLFAIVGALLPVHSIWQVDPATVFRS